MSNIAEIQDNKSSEVEIWSPYDEFTQNCCKITLASHSDFSSMPNIPVQTTSAGNAPDVGFLSAALTQEPVTIDAQPANVSAQTVSVEPSRGSTENIVANFASPKFSFYIALVNTAIMTQTKSTGVMQPNR